MTRYLLIFLATLLTGCSIGLPENNAVQMEALPPAQTGVLAEGAHRQTQQHPGLSGVTPLSRGADAFAARMLLADLATTSIDAQYYIWRSDLTGNLLLERLQAAANRGVRVRLLLDDHGTGGLDKQLVELQRHPNVSIRLWNPFVLRKFKPLSFTYDFFRLNRRMHNKSFTVDGVVSVLGGRNIGDEYFDTGPTALFVDLDMFVAGAIVPHISSDFDLYWNSPSAFSAEQIINMEQNASGVIRNAVDHYAHEDTEQLEEYRQLIADSGFIQRFSEGNLNLEWTQVTLVSDTPAKGQGRVPEKDLLAGHLVESVGTIESQFDGVSAYFVPGKDGVEAFSTLEQRGVQVRLLTNSLEATDVIPVHAGYAKRRKDLLENGAELYELRRQSEPDSVSSKLGPFGSSGASLHAKAFAVDGQKIFVGSFNFDPRSARLNTEMGLLIESESLAQSMHTAFDTGLHGTAWKVEMRDGKLVWLQPENASAEPITEEPGRTFWRSISLTFIGWLPVEWLL
ncbi:phospholipase [Aliidiomarina taiwanensis]|uniref:Phospholipase n=1 Tax=Aliidiomarina taiwanensis TaxID=946228 RepID=A0A432X092_9GAMM|nr:phospholipase D family protein [Aliidiomarina taiwanensis]RUO39352.1 phospholipase [Aliidiomarina taiwanensis]